MSSGFAIEVSESDSDARTPILRVVGGQDTTPTANSGLANQADDAKARLTTHGWRTESVALLVPSTWCWAATISLEGLPRQHRRDAKRYRFEQCLPVSIEQVACDFILKRHSALGVGLDLQRSRPVIEALEHLGIPVQWVCPSALVETAAILEQNPKLSGLGRFVLARQYAIDLIETEDGVVVGWRTTREQQTSLTPFLDQEKELGFQFTDPSIDQSDVLSLPAPEACHAVPAERDRILQDFIQAVAVKGKRLPVDLRRDAIAISDPVRMIRRPLMAAATSLSILMVITTLALFIRMHNLNQLADQHQAAQQEVFQDIFPGVATPLLIRPRLESEHKRLSALSGTSNDLPEPPAAMVDLHTLLARLPDQLRYRILDIRIEDNELFIDGEARSHTDTDAIAVALRDQRGFQIQPPRIERLRGRKGVRFTMTGIAPLNKAAPERGPSEESTQQNSDPRLSATHTNPNQP